MLGWVVFGFKINTMFQNYLNTSSFVTRVQAAKMHVIQFGWNFSITLRFVGIAKFKWDGMNLLLKVLKFDPGTHLHV